MNINKWLTLGTVLLLVSGCQTIKPQQSGPVYLNSDQVYALFADHTVESVGTETGITSFTYYDPDGTLVQQRFWTERRGTWRVNPNGEICLTMEGRDESCRMMAIEPGSFWTGKKDRYFKYRDRGSEAEKVVRYRQFIPGNTL